MIHSASAIKKTRGDLPKGRGRMAALDHKPLLDDDNDSTLKATTVLVMLHWRDVKPSYSRPCMSDDNAFIESLFRTAKYRPEFPMRGFADLQAARDWAAQFVHWYNNHGHLHSRYPLREPCGTTRRA
ncbi:hypothetical protein C6P61_11390 [Malikia spinosa]|uniref:Integrase catalytic domain-containing protein n=1 Tax=Malikia spinosa TaxID=86180 RepID=A0A2S9KD60_9BURK|nr:hypothetical protein C6P61_11390 [Malikia spinosa]